MVRNQAEEFVRGVLGMLEEDKAEIYKNYEQDELESISPIVEEDNGKYRFVYQNAEQALEKLEKDDD